MKAIRTEQTFKQNQDSRDARAAVTADGFKASLAKTKTCVMRAAFNAGISETSLRKMRAGDMHIPLHDLEGWAVSEPELFLAELERLAALAGKRVVDVDVGAAQADRLASAARTAKEAGEAVGAIVSAAAVNDPRADEAVIREGREALAVIGAEVAAAEARKAKHTESLMRRVAPRGHA